MCFYFIFYFLIPYLLPTTIFDITRNVNSRLHVNLNARVLCVCYSTSSSTTTRGWEFKTPLGLHQSWDLQEVEEKILGISLDPHT